MTNTASTPSMIQMFENVVNKWSTKKIIKKLSEYCEKDGASRLEVALELYVGVRKDACLKCKLAKRFISSLIRLGGGSFGASEEQIKEKFRDKYWRKGLANVIKGLGVFGVHKPFIPGAPFQVVWDITYACNLKCKHCYANAGEKLRDELTTSEAKQVIDKLAKMGVVILAFSGGEPLVRHDFYEVAKYASDKGLYVAVATNGTLINKETSKKLKEAGVQYLQISLDGASAKTHDSFRGVNGAFERTIQGIKNAVEEGFFVSVATTATKLNYHEIPKIIELCEELNVNWFMMYNFVPTGRGRFILENDLTPDEREELLEQLWEKLKTSNVSVLSTAPQFARVALEAEDATVIPTHFYNPNLPNQLRSLSDFIGGCGAGRFYMAIKPNGDVIPCVFFPLVVGNVRKDDLEDLWLNSPVFRTLRERDILQGSCGTCPYRYVCGGCRARAFGYFNEITAPDPGCVRNLAFYNRLKAELLTETFQPIKEGKAPEPIHTTRL